MAYKELVQSRNEDLLTVLSTVKTLPPAGAEDISAELDALSDAVNAHLKMVNRKVAENNGEGEFIWKKMTAEGGDFVDYVVSSDSAAYPDGGEQDGYWYEILEQSTEVTINDIPITEPTRFITTTMNLGTELPYYFYDGAAVVYNDAIHILGGASSTTTQKYHYMWNMGTWTKTTNLPYYFKHGCAVIYENEIHILGTSYNATQGKYHYKYDGSAWTKISTLPYQLKSGCAVVLDNEIHILGGDGGDTSHYKWNGSSWTEVSTLPDTFSSGCAVIHNNQIHILGVGSYCDGFYRWNGSEWITVSSSLPYSLSYSGAVVKDNKIHLVGSSDDSDAQNHYSWVSGSGWTSENDLPENFSSGSVIVYNDTIHLLGGSGVLEFMLHLTNPHIELDAVIYRKVV